MSKQKALLHFLILGIVAFFSFPHNLRSTTASAEKELQPILNALRKLNLKNSRRKVNFLPKGGTSDLAGQRIRLQVKKGKLYFFLLGGCADAFSLDLGIYNRATGDLRYADAKNGRLTQLIYVAPRDSLLEILVGMADSTPDGAHYALVVGELDYEVNPAADLETNPAATRIDLDTQVESFDGMVTLREIMGTRDALYIQFWATWCKPSIALLPTLNYRAEHLSSQGVAVAAIENQAWNGGPGGQLENAKNIMDQHNAKLPVYAETKDQPLFEALNIKGLPHSVLLDMTGKVLFSGHPLDARLSAILQELGVEGFNLYGGLEE